MRLSTTVFTAVLVLLTVACVSRPAPYDPDKWLFDKVVFEIAPTTDSEPNARALDQFRLKLHQNNICDYTRIKFLLREATPHTGQFWNGGLLLAYERLRRSLLEQDPTDRELYVFVPYIDGPWLEGDVQRHLGGIQYHSSAFAIFKSGSKNREDSVLLHEFGHLVGLVKDHSVPNHDDSYPNHCVIKSCVMFHTAPKNSADFDLYCKRQIRALIRARRK